MSLPCNASIVLRTLFNYVELGLGWYFNILAIYSWVYSVCFSLISVYLYVKVLEAAFVLLL